MHRTAHGVTRAADPLRAGTIDDNEDLAAFLTYLAQFEERRGRDSIDCLDVCNAQMVIVETALGAPIPSARVQVIDQDNDRVVWSATTQGDGQAPFYPRLDVVGTLPPSLLIEVEVDGHRQRQQWRIGDATPRFSFDHAPVSEEVALDVVFLIDTTGSMGDEIAQIKASLQGRHRKAAELGARG